MENMNCNKSARMQCQPLIPMPPSHQQQFGPSNIQNSGHQQTMLKNCPNYPQQQYHQNGFGWQSDNSSANIQGQNDTIDDNLIMEIMATPITKRGRGRPKKNSMPNNAGIVQKNAIKKKTKQNKAKKNGNKTNNVNEATDDEENNEIVVDEEAEMVQIEQKEPELTPAEKRALTMDERDKKAVTEKYIECVDKTCNGLDLIKADDLFSALCEQTGKYHAQPKRDEEKRANMRERIESLFQSIHEDHMDLAAAMFADRNGELFDRNNPNLHIYVVPKKLDNPSQDRNLQNVKKFRVYGVDFKFLEFAFAIKKMVPIGSGEWSRLESIAGCHKQFDRSVCINVHHYRLKPFTLLEHWINTEFCRSMKMIENGEEEQQMDQFTAHFHESVKSIHNLKAKWDGGKQNEFGQQQQHFGNPNANCFAFLPSNSNSIVGPVSSGNLQSNSNFNVSDESMSNSSEYSYCHNSSTSSSPSLLDGQQQLFPNHSSVYGPPNAAGNFNVRPMSSNNSEYSFCNSSTSSSPTLFGAQPQLIGTDSPMYYWPTISVSPSLMDDQQLIGNNSSLGAINGGHNHNSSASSSPTLFGAQQQLIQGNSSFHWTPISSSPSLLLADQQIIGNYSPMYGPSISASPSLLDDQQFIGSNSPFYMPPNAAREDGKAIAELAEQLKEYEKRKTNKF